MVFLFSSYAVVTGGVFLFVIYFLGWGWEV